MLSKVRGMFYSDNGKVLLGNLAASIFGLITFMLLARALPKHTFGEWAIIVAASGFVDLLRTGLIRQAMVRFITVTDQCEQKKHFQKAAVLLHFLIIVFISFILWSAFFVFEEILPSPYDLFLTWYPLWMLVSLPHMMDTWFSHALKNFSRMNMIGVLIKLAFLLFVLLGFILDHSVKSLLMCKILIEGLMSLISFFRYRNIFMNIRDVSTGYVVQLFRFGKHSLATLTGANLLKSADHIIIGALMGTEAVAIYAIPLKMMDLIEIPLRGFVMTSFLKLSVFSVRRNIEGFVGHFYQWSGLLTLLFVPMGMVLVLFPELFVGIIGGAGFEDSQVLLQVFVIAMVLMPLDKYLGMSFDSINAPKRNAIKVWVMVMVNIVGDIVAILLFDSLLAVSVVTVLMMVSGLVAGFLMHPAISFNAITLAKSGLLAIRENVRRFSSPIVDKTMPSAE